MKELKLEGKRAIAIVAHPDDETIWMGGTILVNPKVHWTIFCLTRARDKDRAPKFKRVCERYNARAIITDLDDEDRLTFPRSVKEAKKLLLKNLGKQRFDYLFTHGSNGEYGHLGHIAVHEAVTDLVKAKKIFAQEIFCFNYKKAKPGLRPSMRAKKNSNFYLKLPGPVFQEKKRIQSEMYGYSWDGIDVGFCTSLEAFKNLR